MNKGLLRLHKQLCKENPGYCVLVMDETTNRYTAFGENAKQAGKALGLPLVGNLESVSFERATLDTYLSKLVQAGLKVAICGAQRV